MRVLIAILLFSTTSVFAQKELSVEVINVPASEGKISVALYEDAESFLKFDRVFVSKSVPAKEGATYLVLKDIPDGEYAVALFYDKNGNDQLDTNWMGIPKEKVAFSNAKMRMFGPPSFEDCAFDLIEDMRIKISF